MSVKGYSDKKNREMQEDIANKDRLQRDEASKRGLVGQVIGAAASILPKGKFELGGSGSSKGGHRFGGGYSIGNGPVWYKQYVKDLDKFLNLPTWLRVSVPTPATGPSDLQASDVMAITSGSRTITSSRLGTQLMDISSYGLSPTRVVTHVFMPHIGVSSREQLDVNAGGTNIDSYSINKATLMTITNLGKVNSRAIDPDVSIPGFYLIAAVDVYSFLLELKEVIDLATYYVDTDAMVPKSIITDKGWNYSEVLTNLADYRKLYVRLRELVLTSIPLPDNLSYLARRLWINTVIIKDAANDKAPYIQFRQAAYGQLNEAGTQITYSAFNENNPTTTSVRYKGISSVEGWFNVAINRIILNDDFNTLIANMRAAKIPFAKLPDLESKVNYAIDANDEVKLQIMNIVTLPHHISRYFTGESNGIASVIGDWAVKQYSDGKLMQNIVFDVTSTSVDTPTASDLIALYESYFEVAATADCSRILNSYIGWDSDKVLVASRLHPVLRGYADKSNSDHGYKVCICIAACGTELVMGTIVTSVRADTLLRTYMYTANIQVTGTLSSNVFSGVASTADGVDKFESRCASIDGMPLRVYAGYKPFTSNISTGVFTWSSTAPFVTPVFEVDNYFIPTDNDLAEVHAVCVLSEFYIPESDFKGFAHE